jgi:phosphatidylglycerol lysyltransferase
MIDAPPAAGDTLDRRLAAVRRWGDFTQAYSTATQAGLEHFWYEDAYLAYQRKWRIACVLGDPVAPPELVEPLLRAFLAQFRKRCLWQISPSTAEVLVRLGFWINEMGVDTRIDLEGYDFNGKRKERLRHATNWLAKHRCFVREGSFSGAGSEQVDVDAIRALSDSWQASRRIRGTVRFFNRPITFVDEPDVRKFFLFDPNGACVAFVFFDPIYRDGQVVGYSPAIKRRAADAPLRAEEGIMKTAIEHFQREGLERVMLGLSPLAGIQDRDFKANPLMHFSWSRGLDAWWINRFFYNLRGHADFKRRFDGVEEQTYFASDALFNDVRVVATLRLAGVL